VRNPLPTKWPALHKLEEQRIIFYLPKVIVENIWQSPFTKYENRNTGAAVALISDNTSALSAKPNEETTINIDSYNLSFEDPNNANVFIGGWDFIMLLNTQNRN
jgi:hypothetical protein